MTNDKSIKVRILASDEIPVYQTKEKESAIIEYLLEGAVLDIIPSDGINPTEVKLASEQVGYVFDAFKYHILQKCSPKNETIIYESLSSDSPVKTSYQKEDEFFISDIIQQDKKYWVRVHDLSGQEIGFMNGDAKIIKKDGVGLGKTILQAIGAGLFGGAVAGLAAHYFGNYGLFVGILILGGVKGGIQKFVALIFMGIAAAAVIQLMKL